VLVKRGYEKVLAIATKSPREIMRGEGFTLGDEAYCIVEDATL
jgi:hypothetical protein